MSIEQWSLFVSTLSLLVTLGMWCYMYRNNNNFEVKVFPDLTNPAYACMMSNNSATAIEVKVITQNIGRQAVVLTNVAIYELHDYGELTSYLDDRPTTLQSDEFLPHIYKRALLPGMPGNFGTWPGFLPNIKHIVAVDSRGRKWEMKKSDIKIINDKINKIINEKEPQQ